jgi:hypothetical protein
MTKSNINERHKDLINIIIRARISIDQPDDPTVLDIMTDMRALPGIVTVRQTQPVSEPINSKEQRVIELKVSYIPSYVKDGMLVDDPKVVAQQLKKVEKVDMIKVIGHDNPAYDFKLKKKPIII